MSNRVNTTRDENLWTASELAEAGNVSEAAVVRDIEAGALKAQRTDEYDDDWLVTDEEARRWLTAQGINPDE